MEAITLDNLELNIISSAICLGDFHMYTDSCVTKQVSSYMIIQLVTST